MRKCSAVLAILLILVCTQLRAAGTSSEVLGRLDEAFAEFDNTNSPGCALGVVQDGRLIVERGYGMANLEHGIRNSTSVVYYIGSTSKQFVAAAILLAAEQGHLSLDDDIRDHLPELPDWGTPITIRHLVHHTSGLRDYLGLMYMADMRFEDVHSDDEVIELLVRQKALNFTPGDEHLYSNSGYFLMAQIVGRATGRTLREFADEEIFVPLGMTKTHFHDDRSMIVRDRAAAYAASDDGGFELDWYLNFDKVGSGGLLTTVEDLARWDGNFYDNQLGGGSLVDDMHVRGVLNSGEELPYAFAIAHSEYRGLKTIGHSGAFMGFRAQLLRFPEQRFSVICLCNVGHASPGALAEEVSELFLAEQMTSEPSTADTGSTETQPAEVVALETAALERHASSFRGIDGGLVRTLRVEDGKLMYVRSEENKTELEPLGPDRFRMAGIPVEVLFEEATDSQPKRMVVQVPGEEVVFEAFERWAPSIDELGGFAGSYYSSELDVVHRFELRDGKPALMIGRNPTEHWLEPTVPGELAGDQFSLQFENAAGEADVMVLNAGRVRDIRFVRQSSE